MPASQTKVELKGAKIVETPSGQAAVSANRFDNIVAVLPAAKEIDNNAFDLDPSDTDVPVSMGNITTAEVVVLVPDGPITIKLNGSSTVIEIDTILVMFGTNITGITASNPSSTEVREVKKYLATSTS